MTALKGEYWYKDSEKGKILGVWTATLWSKSAGLLVNKQVNVIFDFALWVQLDGRLAILISIREELNWLYTEHNDSIQEFNRKANMVEDL